MNADEEMARWNFSNFHIFLSSKAVFITQIWVILITQYEKNVYLEESEHIYFQMDLE